jgi:hypothetical protein
MGMNNAMYQSAWKAIGDKYDSKKPAMQSQLATEFANCFQMLDEPMMETFLNTINDICARMVTDPGDDMKKAQVGIGVIDDFYSFANPKGFVVERFLCKHDRSSDSDCGYCGFSSEATRGKYSGVVQEEISDWGF